MKKAFKRVGEVSAEQIEAWRLQYNLEAGEISEIEVESGPDEISVCYLKPANRDNLAFILSSYDKSMNLEAGEFAIANCWLGGDERLKNPANLKQERIAARAALLAYSVVSLPAGSVKKK